MSCVREQRQTLDSELSEEFEVNVGMHQGSVLLPFLFGVVLDVFIKLARDGVVCELLYADDLVPMSDTIEVLRSKLIKCKEVLENKTLTVKLWITR